MAYCPQRGQSSVCVCVGRGIEGGGGVKGKVRAGSEGRLGVTGSYAKGGRPGDWGRLGQRVLRSTRQLSSVCTCD